MAKKEKSKLFGGNGLRTFLMIVIFLLVAIVSFEVVLLLNPKAPQINANPSRDGNFVDIADCFSRPWEEQNKCFEDFVKNYAEDKEIKTILADLEQARTQNTQIENTCHPIVHAIGRFAYTKYGNVGDAFQSCDLTCHSGCYHGVMERLFYGQEEIDQAQNHLTYEDIAVKVPGICDEDKFKKFDTQIQFQCLHGVGHAVLYSLDYALDDSLKACDLFETEYEKSSCYGGVVMENITAFEKDKRDIKREDPLYPCNRLAERYKYSCYMMQTSLMFEYGMSVAEIADKCREVDNYSNTCFVSLGRDLSNYVRTGRKDHVVEACEVHSKGNEGQCIEGALYALIDNTGNGQFAYEFCNALSENNTERCYKVSNNYLRGTFNRSRSEVTDYCNQFAGENVSLCKGN